MVAEINNENIYFIVSSYTFILNLKHWFTNYG